MTQQVSRRWAALLIVAALGLSAGCGQIRSKLAYKDATKHYKLEEFKKAIGYYEKAIAANPSMAEAHFYLGNSHQALYRPGKESEDNVAHLDKAVEHYKKSIEVNTATDERHKWLRSQAMGFLSAIHSEDPRKDFAVAHEYGQKLVDENPNDSKSAFVLANLYEKFEKVPEAEEIYKKVAADNPNDAKVCGALASFYNKPYWEGRAKFDDAVAILDKCAALNPNAESGYYTLASFYWDKAFRDPLLTAEQRDQYADSGIVAIDKALKIKPDYIEGLVYKNLLLRVKAMATTNAKLAQTYMDEANLLRDRATELKKQALVSNAEPVSEGVPAEEPGKGTGGAQ